MISNPIDPDNVKCDICNGEEEATSHCGECDRFIGSHCLDFHKRFPTSEHHQPQSLGDYFAREKTPITPQKLPRCQKHPSQAVDTYCKTCQTIACANCIIASHSGHHFCPLSVEAEKLKGELSEITATISAKAKEAEEGRKSFVLSLEELEEGKKGAKADMEGAFEMLMVKLSDRKDEIFRKYDAGVHHVEEVMQSEKEGVEQVLDEFRSYLEMNEALISGPAQEVVAGHSKVFCSSHHCFSLFFCVSSVFNC